MRRKIRKLYIKKTIRKLKTPSHTHTHTHTNVRIPLSRYKSWVMTGGREDGHCDNDNKSTTVNASWQVVGEL